jgi:peptide/nickel transport system permease protein
MILWILRRLSQAAVLVVVVSMIVFAGVNVIGDPVEILVAPDATQMEREEIISRLGLDQPLWKQYGRFVGAALQGNLGISFVHHKPALDLVVARLPATLELAVCAMLLGVLVGIPLGMYCGLNPDSRLSNLIMAGSIFGFSLPTFWVGIIFIMFFSVTLGWLPSGGRGETVAFLGVRWSFLTLDGLLHLVLPAINLALFKISMILRLARAGTREVMTMDYIKFARAKGLSRRRIVNVHVMKNIMIPIVTVVGLEFGSVIAFAVVTESIFAWPGMGKLIIDSIYVLDRPVIVAYLGLIAILFVVINLVVDLLYATLDPRVRTGAAQ